MLNISKMMETNLSLFLYDSNTNNSLPLTSPNNNWHTYWACFRNEKAPSKSRHSNRTTRNALRTLKSGKYLCLPTESTTRVTWTSSQWTWPIKKFIIKSKMWCVEMFYRVKVAEAEPFVVGQESENENNGDEHQKQAVLPAAKYFYVVSVFHLSECDSWSCSITVPQGAQEMNQNHWHYDPAKSWRENADGQWSSS